MSKILLTSSKYAFSLWLFVAAGLGIAFSEWSAGERAVWFEWATKLGVVVIFFLQGVSLPTRSLVKGWQPVRLHLFVLTWNYLCFPIVTGLLLIPFSGILASELSIGFMLLAFLPTTVASATAFTAVSGGSTANAIFSTALSNLFAVFVVPLVAILIFAMDPAVEISLFRLWVSVFTLLVVPLLIGQAVQFVVSMDANLLARATRRVSNAIIVLIVYASFSVGMGTGSFEKLSLAALSIVLAGVVMLLLLTNILIWKSAHYLQLEVPQRIAVFFCAGQKSLAAGLPLISSVLIVVPDMPDTSMALIPLLFFHAVQILFAGMAANWFVKNNFRELQ